MVTVAQLCKCTKNHWLVHKQVNFTICRLYFRSALKTKHSDLNQTGLGLNQTEIGNPGLTSECIRVQSMCPTVVLILSVWTGLGHFFSENAPR